MNPPEFIVRRANVDDLEGLKQLWERARLQVLDLEKHLTEFQLAVSMEGDLLGAIALRIQGKEGLMHSEAFTEPENEGQYRPAIWQRLLNLAHNHGLNRIWTREESPYWDQEEQFFQPTPEILQKLPAVFGNAHARWLVLPLREETSVVVSLEKEFELFQAASRASTEQVFAQARRLKVMATVIAFIVFAMMIAVAGVFFFRKYAVPRQPPAAVQQP